MSADFDQFLSRAHTNSIRWDKYPKDVIPLWVADMDFAVPQCVTDAIIHRTKHPIYGYTHVSEDFKSAIQKYLLEQYHYEINPDWLVFLPSVVSGLHMCARNLMQSGDHALIPRPAYHHFQMALEGAQHAFSHYSMHLRAGRLTIDFDELKGLVRNNTKLLFICNPHNPGGTVFTKDELEELVRFAKAHRLIICSDEIHADLILDADKHHYPLGKVDSEFTGGVSLMSLNKTFNFPGIGLGWAIIQDPAIRSRFARDLYTLIPGPHLMAFEVSHAVLKEGRQWHQELIAYLRNNRVIVSHWVQSHSQLTMADLEATYLAWINAKELKNRDLYKDFLKVGVAISPGSQFGSPEYFRLNFGTSAEMLKKALERMSLVLQ